jgi:GST-like protein
VNWQAQGQDIAEFPYFRRWQAEIAARPGVQRGMAVGADLQNDPSKLSAEEQERRNRMLFNQRARPAPVGGLL